MKTSCGLRVNVFPEPVIGYAIEPKKQVDADKLGMAIAKLVEEDPTLTCKYRSGNGPDHFTWYG
jgi:elongation factor G